MKKLIYAGLTALTMLLGMLGFAKAQNTHTVTFNPVQGSIVKPGTTISVSVTPTAEEVLFKAFASKEEAEQEAPSVSWDPIDGSADGTPKVTLENPVLAVAVKTEGNAYEVFYAEYTVVEEENLPRLSFPELSQTEEWGNKYYLYGRYTPFKVELTYAGQKQTNFELYYGLERAAAPTKESYNPDNDPLLNPDMDSEDKPGAIRKAVATDGYAEVMIENGAAPYFKALAYFTPEGSENEIRSELLAVSMTAISVSSPSWSIGNDRWSIGGREVERNTVVKLVGEEGCEFYYSMDGETMPLKSAFNNGSDKVFKYNDEQGIKITETMIVWAMAFKEVNGIFSGSGRIGCRFDVKKPTVNVSLNLEADESGNYAWTIGKEAPIVKVTLPEGEDITLGAGAGKVAVKLSMNDGNPLLSWEQYITQLETPLDMSRAIEANHENEWSINLSLVEMKEGVDTTEISTISIQPIMMALAIVKEGEKPAKPVANIPSGTVEVGTKITLSCETEGATIYYTLGPEEPNVVYTEGYEFTVNAAMSIRTLARKDGIASDLAVYTYKIPIPDLTVEATVDPAPGEIPAGTEITITLSEEQGRQDILGYMLYATLEEAESDLSFNTFCSYYPAEGKPVPTVETPVLRVGVYKEAPRQWKYFYFEYMILKDIPMPVINPQGGLVKKGTEVEISLAEGAEGAKIYYTLDGSEPTKESTEYTQKIAINEELTLKAIAIKTADDKDLVSNIAEAEFTLYPVAPVITPESCALDSGSIVRIFKGNADTLVVIVGSDFAPTITKHTDSVATVTIVRETLVRAYVIKGELHSDTTRMVYTINPNTANEYKELAGVSVYPNPTDGEIHISLPVNAAVEVFTTNGQMVKRIQMNAGVNAMRLENSGIYFIRFTAANGQVAIKKVVIR